MKITRLIPILLFLSCGGEELNRPEIQYEDRCVYPEHQIWVEQIIITEYCE